MDPGYIKYKRKYLALKRALPYLMHPEICQMGGDGSGSWPDHIIDYIIETSSYTCSSQDCTKKNINKVLSRYDEIISSYGREDWEDYEKIWKKINIKGISAELVKEIKKLYESSHYVDGLYQIDYIKKQCRHPECTGANIDKVLDEMYNMIEEKNMVDDYEIAEKTKLDFDLVNQILNHNYEILDKKGLLIKN